MKKIKKLLIANRGEIAIRVARTAKRMGIPTVAIYSELDKKSQHLDFCDEAYSLGDGVIADTYLNVAKIMAIAKATGANAIHPGYGFLSERPHFVNACEENGIIFVGPSADSMNSMGDKIQSKLYMKKLGVPLVPGSDGALKTVQEARAVASKIGYPVLLKASAGGGGKGMRIVHKEADLDAALEAAAREAKAYFGDGTVFMEKYLTEPHHVEVQVMGDGKGGGGHVFDRECSLQRRHQKLLEEAPAPLLLRHTDSRNKILELSTKVVEAMKYAAAGTFEFVADDDGSFYFLEMNTRLQVEHPVTELITGTDLVEWQLRVSDGEKLPKGPLVPAYKGHAIEVRIYAETPFDHLPTGGRVQDVFFPQGPFVRADSSIYRGYDVPTDYDPTLLKLAVWGDTRDQAIDRLYGALGELKILGVMSNQALFREVCQEEQFRSGLYGTKYLEQKREILRANSEKSWVKYIENLAPGLIKVSLSQSAEQNQMKSQQISAWEQAAKRYNVEGSL